MTTGMFTVCPGCIFCLPCLHFLSALSAFSVCPVCICCLYWLHFLSALSAYSPSLYLLSAFSVCPAYILCLPCLRFLSAVSGFSACLLCRLCLPCLPHSQWVADKATTITITEMMSCGQVCQLCWHPSQPASQGLYMGALGKSAQLHKLGRILIKKWGQSTTWTRMTTPWDKTKNSVHQIILMPTLWHTFFVNGRKFEDLIVLANYFRFVL